MGLSGEPIRIAAVGLSGEPIRIDAASGRGTLAAMLYLGTHGHVVAIDPATGGEVWRTKLRTGSFFNAPSASDVTVISDGRSVLAGSSGHLFGLDPADGRILWHNPLRGLGNGHLSLALPGVAVQFVEREIHTSTTTTVH